MTCSTSLTATLDDFRQECRSKRPAFLQSELEEFPPTCGSSITRARGLWLFRHDWQDNPLAKIGAQVAPTTVLESNH